VILAATAQPANGQPAGDTPVRKTERALDEPTILEFVDTPLQDVLDYFGEQHKVKFEFAPETQTGAKAVAPRTPVTLLLKSLSLRSALHLLLDRYELEVTVKPDGTLLLVPSTKELKARRVESEVQKTAHAKLNDTLRTATARMEYVNTPLADVIAYLADEKNCSIVLDHQSLAARGIARDALVTCSLDEFSLSRTLQCVLASFDLQTVVQDEVLLIVGRDPNSKPKPSPEVAKALTTKLDIDLAKELYVIARYFTKKTDRVFVIKARQVTPEEALKSIEPKLPLKLIERDGIVLISIEARK
jgi:hypothetical protein